MKMSPAKALWLAAHRFRRIALQPLDLCPPCDVQFIDYARAVIRNDILTNPVDKLGYRQIMLDVFHRRGLCSCAYIPGRALPANCLFQEALQIERLDFVFLDTDRLSRSRTAASYFLNDNLDILHIPPDKNFRVVDLYDINKLRGDSEMLPARSLVYAWQEKINLQNDPQAGLDFGQWNGKSILLDCGGTLVFDVRGNLLSWFRKPGTEHLTEDRENDIRQRLTAWMTDPQAAEKKKVIS